MRRYRRRRSATASYPRDRSRSEEHTSELQSHSDLVCRLLLEKKKKHYHQPQTYPAAQSADRRAIPRERLLLVDSASTAPCRDTQPLALVATIDCGMSLRVHQ